MKTIQETFDAVIKAGHYPFNPRTLNKLTSSSMCFSLNYACEAGVITHAEKTKAKNAIERYLGDRSPTLIGALLMSGYGNDRNRKFRKEIYRCWAGRPPLKRIRKS